MNKVCIAVCVSFLATATMAGSIEDAREAFINGQYVAALKIALPAAKGGDPAAQNIVGVAYNDGKGVEKDIPASIDWFKKAAVQGNVKAMYNLGLAYRNDVTPPDFATAITYFEQAMKQDYPSAYTQRGDMYKLGQGSDPMPDRARIVLRRAAELDDMAGIGMLADLYRTGQGGDQDLNKARSLYARAAGAGDGNNMGNLALMYENGMGAEKDTTAAYSLYLAAVDLGDANSAINLASFIIENDGYWHDPATAYAYCLWGLDLLGDDRASKGQKDTCDWVKSNLNKDEISTAIETFQSW